VGYCLPFLFIGEKMIEEIKNLSWKEAHTYLAKHGYGPGNISALKKEWKAIQEEKKKLIIEKDK
tara:strand:+ start:208 stop:399 length:192 start_codon:yes stop_codon:yes gene_type:complete